MGVVIDALAQTVISNLCGAITNLLNETKDYILNATDDLEKLQRKLTTFQKDIKDADLKPFFSKKRDRNLEAELKDVLHDAEDIILEYLSKIEPSKRDQVRKRSWTTAFTSLYENVSSRYQLGNKITEINERLDKIKKVWDMVYSLTPKGGGENPVHGEHDNPHETTHHMGVQPPTGRGDDKKEIVKRLLSNESRESTKTHMRRVSIISIVGKGGIGKTTLAKMVFNEIEQQFRERRWWVCVSERPNRKDLLRKILKEVRKESKGDVDSSLSELCTQLQKELSKGQFLLVLDDVWELQWWEEDVKATLMRGAMGSKILITSRNKDVSYGMHSSYMHELQEFNFQQSWDLFLKEALSEGKKEQDLVIHNVRDVAEGIVKKCGGLPLVIKTVGSMMRTKKMSREDWKFVQDSEIWKWKMPATSSSSIEIGGHILPGLILSYDDLPYHLKSCFVYCCIYPKDYEIKRERLIMQWVAHGLIDEGIDVEATANQHIEDLIRRCLIEENENYKGPHLKLHDILHDLALYIGGREYSHASTTEHTRHLSLLDVDNATAAMHNATTAPNKLRTLLTESLCFTESLPLVQLTNLKWLRVLSLRECQMEELPKSIEDLALLKYLDLSSSCVRRLPSSIGKLCNLQTLDLSCSKIEELPKEMGKLCDLRYLGLAGTPNLEFVAEGLGELTNLRTLHRFMVCDDKGKTRGCNINELKDLNKLKGELSIEGLRGVVDAKKALLKDKHELSGVFLLFNEGEDNRADNASKEKGLLEALEPPHGIERLGIRSYKGDMPAWFGDRYYVKLQTLWLFNCPSWAAVIGIKSLEKLELLNCPTLCALPSMPLLKTLSIRECDGLNTIGDLPAVESLWISDCDGLNTIGDLPAVESLEIRDCDGLNTIGDMPAVKELTLSRLPNWESILTSMPSPLPSQVSTFLPSLKRLTLRDNTYVGEKVKWGRVPVWVWGLSQLEDLTLYSFSEEISLGGHWQSLPKLRYLWLFEFPNLKSLVEVNNNITLQQQQIACLSNLQSLRITSCPALHLPQQLRDQLGGRLHVDDHNSVPELVWLFLYARNCT